MIQIKQTTHHITREEIRANPYTMYLFGDNYLRVGYGGQAKEFRDERNTHGIITKWAPTTINNPYMTDAELENNKRWIRKDFLRLIERLSGDNGNGREYNTVVIPALGTGLSGLPKRAPKTYQYLLDQIEELKQLYASNT